MRNFKFSITVLIAITLVLPVSLGSILFQNNTTSALSGSQFKAGKIITDSLFYTGSAMNKDRIQAFLNNRVKNCDTQGKKLIYDSAYNDTVTRKKYSERRGVSTPFICLKNYSQSTPNISANAQCSAYSDGSGGRSAARIIYEVGKACNISQKALLVLLQKEQSLVTDDWPWPVQYKKATGYGCPDTAACDSQYYGFFNQVYNAAWQFNKYKNNSNDYGHLPNRNNFVRFHPNSSCGSKKVYISNYATAGLYNYTPYTPNKAALNNLYGTGNSCSSYGNRNFWRMYTDWFGSTLKEPQTAVLSGDWNGNGENTIGLKVNSTYYLDNNNDGTPDITFKYGFPKDTPIAGDWDNDGRDEIGVKRSTAFYLNYNNDGVANAGFKYGFPKDTPIAGDWDNDGKDEIAIKRGNTYYLNYNNDGHADAGFRYGFPKDTPIAGDWNNNGKDTIGIKRGNTYYLNNGFNGYANTAFRYGFPADLPITGDWNGNGNDSVGIKRNYTLYLNNNHDGFANIAFEYFVI